MRPKENVQTTNEKVSARPGHSEGNAEGQADFEMAIYALSVRGCHSSCLFRKKAALGTMFG